VPSKRAANSGGGTKRAASGAARAAKAQRAVGKYLPRDKKALRDSAIIAQAFAGASHADLAAEFGVSERSVRDIVGNFHKRPSLLNTPPLAIVEDLIALTRSMVGEFQAMAARTEETNPAVALGAKRQARESLSDLVVLLASIGKLPTDLEVLAAQADLLRMGDLILEHVEMLQRGEITVDRLVQVTDEILQARGLPPGDVIEGTESKPDKSKRKRGG
jgi:hypothetical protein